MWYFSKWNSFLTLWIFNYGAVWLSFSSRSVVDGFLVPISCLCLKVLCHTKKIELQQVNNYRYCTVLYIRTASRSHNFQSFIKLLITCLHISLLGSVHSYYFSNPYPAIIQYLISFLMFEYFLSFTHYTFCFLPSPVISLLFSFSFTPYVRLCLKNRKYRGHIRIRRKETNSGSGKMMYRDLSP